VPRKILIVDDEPDFRKHVARSLEKKGFAVNAAASGNEALRQVASIKPDLILLDIYMPPGLNGHEVLQRLRQNGDNTPVIMLTHIGDQEDILRALRWADDYVNKPFDSEVLAARIEAVLRRVNSDSQQHYQNLRTANCLSSDGLGIDKEKHQTTYKEKALDLRFREFVILEYLMIHPNIHITKERLIEVAYGETDLGSFGSLKNCIWRIRKQLNDDATTPKFIKTIPGYGYVFIGEVRIC
jgi:DNA-binding response OmpR family regulator